MARRCGRPSKSEETTDTKQRIIEAVIQLIKKEGADQLTVRNVCRGADVTVGTFYHYFRDKDDLMMYFLKEIPFEEIELLTPPSNISDRISELYMHLINQYTELGIDFMKSFYSTSNRSLSAYMGETDGVFEPGTVMARCEAELTSAQNAGIITSSADIHMISMDICTIVKGCVFEWCLNDGSPDIEVMIHRIIKNYILKYTT